MLKYTSVQLIKYRKKIFLSTAFSYFFHKTIQKMQKSQRFQPVKPLMESFVAYSGLIRKILQNLLPDGRKLLFEEKFSGENREFCQKIFR